MVTRAARSGTTIMLLVLVEMAGLQSARHDIDRFVVQRVTHDAADYRDRRPARSGWRDRADRPYCREDCSSTRSARPRGTPGWPVTRSAAPLGPSTTAPPRLAPPPRRARDHPEPPPGRRPPPTTAASGPPPPTAPPGRSSRAGRGPPKVFTSLGYEFPSGCSGTCSRSRSRRRPRNRRWARWRN